jgi:peptidoglycan/LPS O-acetylase OafA/YrhL
MQLNSMYHFVPQHHIWVSFALWIAILLPILLVLIWLSFRCIEDPFLGLRGRYIGPAIQGNEASLTRPEQTERALVAGE